MDEPIWDVDIPEGKDPKQYNYRERRKEIINLIFQAGNLRLIRRTELAKRYGISNNMIKKDINIIKRYIADNIGKEMQVDTAVLYEKAIRSYIQQEDFIGAWKILEGMNEFLFNIGKVKRAPTQMQIEGKVTVEEIVMMFDEYDKQNQKVINITPKQPIIESSEV